MKVIKSMKKLKFWSRSHNKKKKIKDFNVNIDHFLPPPQPQPTSYHSCNYHHFHHPIQPSAPPLPSWLDFDQTQNPLLATQVSGASFSSIPDSMQFQFDNDIEASLPVSTNSSSYQQYMVENPVYGVPVVQPPPPRRESCGGVLGCVVNIGVHFIRCFCPFFRIRKIC